MQGGPASMSRTAWTVRTVAAAAICTIVLLLDLTSFSQLIFAGPLAPSLVAGLGAMLSAYIVGSLIFVATRRAAPVTLSFIGGAAIVQAAVAATVAERLRSAGLVDPDLIGRIVLLVCGVTTFATGAAFLMLGIARASLLAQLLPYPVLTGFLGGVGMLFLKSGSQIGARVADPFGPHDPGMLARLGLTLAIGACVFYLPRRVPHWTVYPGVVLGTFVATHAMLAWFGIDPATAQHDGWLLDPLPGGTLLRMPAARGLGSLDLALLLSLLPQIATQVVVAIVIQLLYVLSVELEMQRDLDIDSMFVSSGAANLIGSLFGSPAMGFGRTSTLLLHNLGGGNWLGWSLTIVVMAALLALGAAPLALLPRPLAGGTLIAIGLGLMATLALAYRSISLWETVIALIVAAATVLFGATQGFLVGIALAILIFAVQYGQIPAIRLAQSGIERPSSVIRAPDATQALQGAGRRTLIYTLQGYLFFLNAQAVYHRAAATVAVQPDLRFLVLDFRECVGLDSSALIAFRKVAQLAERHGFDVLLVHVAPTAVRQVTRGGLAARSRMRVLGTLDHALLHAEAVLLAEVGLATDRADATFAEQLGQRLHRTVVQADLAPYLTSRTLDAGETLLRQGGEADTLYFVESGVVSIELEVENRPNLRLRTTMAGTVIGEVAMMQGGLRTATAVAETGCVVVGVSRDALTRMEHERPDLALLLQRFLILELASKVADTNRLLQATFR